MKHPETHKRMTDKGQRRQRCAIAMAMTARRPSTRWLRRVFLRAIKGTPTFSQGIRKWAGMRSKATV